MTQDRTSVGGMLSEASTALLPNPMGTRHMIVAGHYLAAHAGFQILEAGGNAIDAGVAAGIALGVVQSDLVNVAGVAPILIYVADRQELISISGLGTWPRALPPDLFRRDHDGKIPSGVLRTVVPAAPDAWITALELHGTMSFGEVAHSAIRFAADGFPMHPLMAQNIANNVEALQRWSSSAEIYLPGGSAPGVGDVFVQADLGRTLQYMADQEAAAAGSGREAGLKAARDAFYSGDIARAIVRYHEDNGGYLTAADLAEFKSEIEQPQRITFAGVDVYSCGPWCQGPVLLQGLRLLEGYDLKALGHNSAAYAHTVLEALKLAFADRHHYYGDPNFTDVPMAALLSDAYSAARRELIRPDKAWPEMPPPGDAANLSAVARHGAQVAVADSPAPAVSYDTSYVAVVDRHGNAFSATPSDPCFNMPVVPGTGLAPSSRGSQSWVDPNHPSGVAPGKRPRLTPNPALAIRAGEFVMPFGTPGGDVQSQAMLQTFINMVVFGMDPQSAVEAPRFVTFSFPDSFAPHDYFPGRVNLESRIPREVGDALQALGHDVEWWPDWIWRAGSMCVVYSDLKRGVHISGADPRRPSYALGW